MPESDIEGFKLPSIHRTEGSHDLLDPVPGYWSCGVLDDVGLDVEFSRQHVLVTNKPRLNRGIFVWPQMVVKSKGIYPSPKQFRFRNYIE